MKSFLTAAGLQALETAKTQNLRLSLTGAQVGTAFGFTPNDAMLNAQGSLIVDNKNKPEGVKVTLVHTHELIFSVYLDQYLDAPQVGNILIFANNLPFLWNISEAGLAKKKIDPVAHFTGDEYYFSTVMRYPYLRRLINYNPVQGLHARFPNIDHIFDVSIEAHTASDQLFVENNDLWYGQNHPFFASKAHDLVRGWMATPITMPLDSEKFGTLDGGTTKLGF